ncbi:TPA: hypothetical protein ACH3X3_005091 [Trebouxia sp. C0006]
MSGTQFPGLHGHQQDDLPAELLDGLIQFDQPTAGHSILNSIVMSRQHAQDGAKHHLQAAFGPIVAKPMHARTYRSMQSAGAWAPALCILHMCSYYRFVMYASNLCTTSFKKPERRPYTQLNVV